MFFISFFLLFTIIPRYLHNHIGRLLNVNKNRNIFDNYSDILITYLVIGIPLSSILFYASTFGNQNKIHETFGVNTPIVIMLTTIIILVSIRLSLVMKKREYIKKIPLLKILERIAPETRDRKQLKNEYISYLFDIFFTAFLSFTTILIFTVLFLREKTNIDIGGYQGTLQTIFISISTFLNSNLLSILTIMVIPFVAELLIKILGSYE